MSSLLEDVEQNITPRMRKLLDHLWQEWKTLNSDVEGVSQDIEAIASQDAACQRLRQIPGVGPLVSTATVAAIGNGAAFRKGREFAAWLAQVRHGMVENPPNPFRISSGNSRVYTTFAIELKTLG
jgi:transposase